MSSLKSSHFVVKVGGLICLLPPHSYTILPPLEAQCSPKRCKSFFELHFPKKSSPCSPTLTSFWPEKFNPGLLDEVLILKMTQPTERSAIGQFKGSSFYHNRYRGSRCRAVSVHCFARKALNVLNLCKKWYECAEMSWNALIFQIYQRKTLHTIKLKCAEMY